jgi:hypothetical protein
MAAMLCSTLSLDCALLPWKKGTQVESTPEGNPPSMACEASWCMFDIFTPLHVCSSVQVGDEGMSLEALADAIQVDPSDIVRTLFMKGIMLSLNQVRTAVFFLKVGGGAPRGGGASMSQLVRTAVYSFANVQKQLEHLLVELDVEVKHRAVVRASLSARNTKASALASVPSKQAKDIVSAPHQSAALLTGLFLPPCSQCSCQCSEDSLSSPNEIV